MLALLGASEGDERYQWVKTTWLGVREARLIEQFQPACNSGVAPDPTREPVGSQAFLAALRQHLASPLLPFARAAAQEAPMEQLGDDDVEDTTIADDLPFDGNEEPVERDGEMTIGEERFRARLSEAGEAFVNEFEQRCPVGMTLDFPPANGDLRLYLEEGHRVLLRIQTRKQGQLAVFALADQATCRALGFDSQPSGPWQRFVIDPATVDISALLALAGASLGAVAVGQVGTRSELLPA